MQDGSDQPRILSFVGVLGSVGAVVVVGAGGRQVVTGVIIEERAWMRAFGGPPSGCSGLVGGGFVDAVVVQAFELALAETGDAAVTVGRDLIGVAAGGGSSQPRGLGSDRHGSR